MYSISYGGSEAQWQDGQEPKELQELTDALADVVDANSG